MQGLAHRICDGNNPNRCDMTTDLYNYMGNVWQSGSACGTDGSSWCTIGNHRNDHDALCVREEGSCGDHDVDCIGHWDEWTECSHDCDGGQQTRTFHVTVEAQGNGAQCDH